MRNFAKQMLTLCGYCLLCCSGDVLAAPNVIVIISDDAGYADFGFQHRPDFLSGTSDVPTPNLDALASRGVTFSRAYVAANCQPTRAALVTGGYQQRIGNESVGNNLFSAVDDPSIAETGFEGVPVETDTIWDRMKSQGYVTGAVGKWHLGQHANSADNSVLGNRPQNQGVDEFYGHWHGSRDYTVGSYNLNQVNNPDSPLQTRYLRETVVDSQGTVTDTVVEGVHNGQYITNTFGNYGVDFIKNHANGSNPFFLYQSFTAPHEPWDEVSPAESDPEFLNAIAGKNLSPTKTRVAGMMYTMDQEIGRMMAALEDPDGDGNNSDSITDETMVVFLNDNGGLNRNPKGPDNLPLSGWKGSAFEGGIRVPMIVAGAGIDASKQGTLYDRPVHGIDILPTAVAAAGGTLGPNEEKIDGTNILPFVNGTETSDPHDVLVHKWRGTFAVIKGDWKLLNRNNNNPDPSGYELYNVVTDVSEQNDLNNAANTALVEELKRDLTNHETFFDKPRYAILSNTVESEPINLNDHFRFNPNPGTAGTTDVVIIEGTTGNGDFEASEPATGVIPFSNTANWFNASGPESEDFTRDNQTNGSSQSASRAGEPLDGRVQINDTGYTIAAEGEVLNISYDFGAGGSSANWGGDELMRTFVFTSTATVDGETLVGNITELAGDTYAIDRASDGQWTTRNASGFYTTTAADVGKTIYFGMEFQDPTVQNTLSPRIDVVSLTATVQGLATATTNWSETDAWFEGGSNDLDTLLTSDSFAGAILEFPTTEGFSYISNNDMVRKTGLEFMLNKVMLTGTFGGTSNQSATIQGNTVIFTKDLNGASPQIAASATNSGSASYTYEIDLDVIMYHDVELTGDGDVAVTINGEISSYFEPSGLKKTGTSTFTLTGDNSYTGDTTVEAGTLSITNAYLEDTADVYLETGAIFDLDFDGTDAIDSLFIDGVSQAIGTWGAIGSGANNETALITGTGLLSVSTLATLAGDFDFDGDVDGSDFLTWQRGDGTPGGLADFQANYGSNSLSASSSSVPEPAALALLLIGFGYCGLFSRTRLS